MDFLSQGMCLPHKALRYIIVTDAEKIGSRYLGNTAITHCHNIPGPYFRRSLFYLLQEPIVHGSDHAVLLKVILPDHLDHSLNNTLILTIILNLYI